MAFLGWSSLVESLYLFLFISNDGANSDDRYPRSYLGAFLEAQKQTTHWPNEYRLSLEFGLISITNVQNNHSLTSYRDSTKDDRPKKAICHLSVAVLMVFFSNTKMANGLIWCVVFVWFSIILQNNIFSQTFG